ncbi:MAG: hydantoinase/oxoprolinase family protein [Burkholderiaceae bacterium]
MAADTGGTFTDVAVYDTESQSVSYGKTLTRYGDLVDGVLDGLEEAGASLPDTVLLKHGTTHVINTFLQRSGARTALVATQGFKDLVEIGRGNRPVPFQVNYRRDPPLVPRDLRFELRERIDSSGRVVTPIETAAIDALCERLSEAKVEAVAVSFVNAYLNPSHEQLAARMIAERLPQVYVTSGTSLTREWYEYERTSTAEANAYVGARMRSYMQGFDQRLRNKGFDGQLYMMGSNGGVLSVARTIEQPVALVESGPIGGCIGAAAYSKALDRPRMIAFDMGGTTAKCALVIDGRYDVQPIYYVGGYERGFPLKTPVLDIVEVGAGGGSIASVDSHGQLSVGPRSAGSEPGPVAFGRGGTEPTVTDANLVLGRIGDGAFVGGKLRLDRAAAERAILDKVAKPLAYSGADAVDIAAAGVLALACGTMKGAIREITIERGVDARAFSLFVFGGGGPLFGSILARDLGIPEVIVPPQPGNFSTLGMLLAGARIDLVRTLLADLDAGALRQVDEVFAGLRDEAAALMLKDLGNTRIDFDYALEARYLGQNHTVRVAYANDGDDASFTEAFRKAYRERYGHVNDHCPIQLVALRLGATAEVPRPLLRDLAANGRAGGAKPVARRSVYFPKPHGRIDVDVWRRADLPVGFELTAPAIIEEFSSTCVLMPGDRARVGELGEIIIDCTGRP